MSDLTEKRIVVESGERILHDLNLEEFLRSPDTELKRAVTALLNGHPAELQDYCEKKDLSVKIIDRLRPDISQEDLREISKQEPVETIEMPTITNPGGIGKSGILEAHFPDDPIISIEGWKYFKGDKIVFEDGEIAQIAALMASHKGDSYLLNYLGAPREAVALDRFDVERRSSKFT